MRLDTLSDAGGPCDSQRHPPSRRKPGTEQPFCGEGPPPPDLSLLANGTNGRDIHGGPARLLRMFCKKAFNLIKSSREEKRTEKTE